MNTYEFYRRWLHAVEVSNQKEKRMYAGKGNKQIQSPDGLTREQNVHYCRAELEKAEAALSAEVERAAFVSEINRKIRLANAIALAFVDVRDSRLGVLTMPVPKPRYAEFKSELCATLKEYGYKIVLIGDKTHGVLAKS